MKAYLFNSENGIYSGEDFVAPHEIRENDGITMLPPPDRPSGCVPVFDRTSRQWQLVPLADLKSAGERHE